MESVTLLSMDRSVADKGGGGGNPDREKWQLGGGAWSQKQFFLAPQAGGTPLDLPRRVKVD